MNHFDGPAKGAYTPPTVWTFDANISGKLADNNCLYKLASYQWPTQLIALLSKRNVSLMYWTAI